MLYILNFLYTNVVLGQNISKRLGHGHIPKKGKITNFDFYLMLHIHFLTCNNTEIIEKLLIWAFEKNFFLNLISADLGSYRNFYLIV